MKVSLAESLKEGVTPPLLSGGHLAEGSLVYTTAEVVIVELVGARFRREIDPATSYKELVVE